MNNPGAEAPLNHPQEQAQQDFSLQAYEHSLHDMGVRTGRHASEIGHAPQEEDIKRATVAIRRVIAPAFAMESETPHDEETDLDSMKTRYWERASRVGVEHGAINEFELQDYFTTSESRSYFALRQDLLERNPEGGLGRELLETIDIYHKTLDINPAHAATITSELISKGRSEISALALQHTDVAPEEATRLAFKDFMTQTVPPHITRILQECGQGENVVKALTKQSFYPPFEEGEAAPLPISEEDKNAMVEVFDLQNRPYSRAELRMANDIAKLPAMQMAMLGVHERLIGMSEAYFKNHPERMTGDLSSWSEIFVPERHADGTVELLPNPKLMRAITNNVLPAVAGRLLERGVDIDEMTTEDISQGAVIASRTYKLLQSKIGLFRQNPGQKTIELGDITTVVCPANQAFPTFLQQYLGPDYSQLKELEIARQ